MDICPCGSSKPYVDCCRPLISGERLADTAEQVMRSRYTAFVKMELAWLRDSLHPGYRADYDEASSRAWAERAEWHGLQILKAEKGGLVDQEGMVEFVASLPRMASGRSTASWPRSSGPAARGITRRESFCRPDRSCAREPRPAATIPVPAAAGRNSRSAAASTLRDSSKFRAQSAEYEK
jgi:uncharacterized protein YchJ